MSQNSVVSVRDLTREFGKTRALSGVNLELRSGSVIGLLGPNGCGKTTLLKHLLGVLLPSRGHVDVFGTPSSQLTREQVARMGYVSQDVEMMCWLTVGETLAFARSHHRTWDDGLADRMIAEFTLRNTQKVGSLSGGQKQRLAIILGVAHRPDLLLLDEPASALDPVARQEFLDLLMELIQEPGRTVVISSHILTDVEKVIDQVLIMDHGAVHCFQPLDDLKEEYYRVRLAAVTGDLPDDLGLTGVKSLERDGGTAAAIVHNPHRDLLKREVDRLGCTAEIRNLEFEEIYRLVVTGK